MATIPKTRPGIGEVRERRAALYAGLMGLGKEERARELKSNPEAYWAYLAGRGMEDTWFFCNKILRIPVLYKPLHKPLCDSLDHWGEHQKKLLLMARGHVKSNIITVGKTLQEIARNPDSRTLIGSHTDVDTRKFLRSISTTIFATGQDSMFNRVYPEICPAMGRGRPVKWNDKQIQIDRDTAFIDPTVDTATVESPSTGSHFSRIMLDDLVNERNTNNLELIQKATTFHGQCQSLLDPGGREFLIGTRYVYNDMYGAILDDPRRRELYDVHIVPAVKDWSVFHGFVNGKAWTRQDDYKYLAFPKRFTLAPRDIVSPDGDELKAKKSLVQTYISQGSTTFANQYMLEPFDTSKAIFQENALRVIDSVPAGPLRYFRFCDLSTVKHTGDSYTAIITMAVDHLCNVFITDIWWGDFNPDQIIDELFRGQQVHESVKPIKVVFEKAPFERVLDHFIRRRAIAEGTWIPTAFLGGGQSNKTKEQRILGLQSWFEAGRVHILRSCRNRNIMEEELLKFSIPMKFKRVDTIDALAQFPPMIFPGQAPEQNTADLDAKKHHELNNPHALTLDMVYQKYGLDNMGDEIVYNPGLRRYGAAMGYAR